MSETIHDPNETIGGIRRVCIEELTTPGGDRSVCTLHEVDIWNAGQKRLVEGVDKVDDAQDVTAENTLGIKPEEHGHSPLDSYMNFWTDIAGGDPYITVGLSVGTPAMIVAGLLALLQGRKRGGYHSHGSDPIANIRGAH